MMEGRSFVTIRLLGRERRVLLLLLSVVKGGGGVARALRCAVRKEEKAESEKTY